MLLRQLVNILSNRFPQISSFPLRRTATTIAILCRDIST